MAQRNFTAQINSLQSLAHVARSYPSDYVVTRFEATDLPGGTVQVIREYGRLGSTVRYHEQWMVGPRGAAKRYHDAIHY